jgi:hypothetical protein
LSDCRIVGGPRRTAIVTNYEKEVDEVGGKPKRKDQTIDEMGWDEMRDTETETQRDTEQTATEERERSGDLA